MNKTLSALRLARRGENTLQQTVRHTPTEKGIKIGGRGRPAGLRLWTASLGWCPGGKAASGEETELEVRGGGGRGECPRSSRMPNQSRLDNPRRLDELLHFIRW